MAEKAKNNVEEVVQEAPLENQSEAPAADAPAVDLSVNDLVVLRSIVEVASQRGAFKAAELEVVGKSFNKLNAFLESVTATKEE
jgi:hypothetical protein